MHTGVANLPLHGGRAPVWLFRRMSSLAREIARIIIEEEGEGSLLVRLSDPFWFQALGCLLGFDWHSSGLTTTTCGALKEGLGDLQPELGFFVAGGKGARSRRTPQEILEAGARLAPAVDPEKLITASRLSAKVDSAAVQDGYQIYHHAFFFTRTGQWAVVQQGMNEQSGYARRYHWLSTAIADPVEEPHAAVCCDQRGAGLNLVARASRANRQALPELAAEQPERLLTEISRLRTLNLPSRHALLVEDVHPERLRRVLLSTYEHAPADFRELLLTAGLGARTLRALSLTAELLFGASPSFEDPARFAFAHGGKDGHPYPVDRQTYDRTIDFLARVVGRARVDRSERRGAFERLSKWATAGAEAGEGAPGAPAAPPRRVRRRAGSTPSAPATGTQLDLL
jgi:hypothetical protein